MEAVGVGGGAGPVFAPLDDEGGWESVGYDNESDGGDFGFDMGGADGDDDDFSLGSALENTKVLSYGARAGDDHADVASMPVPDDSGEFRSVPVSAFAVT